MRQGSAEKTVRRNITLPASFSERLEALKLKRGGASDSEVLRQAINLLEAVTRKNKTIVLRDNETGEEVEFKVV